MSRFIQQENRPKKEVKEEKRELKKPGQYSSEELMNTKRINTNNGRV